MIYVASFHKDYDGPAAVLLAAVTAPDCRGRLAESGPTQSRGWLWILTLRGKGFEPLDSFESGS